ncbi:hypothetical protein [Hyalangium versicolor]|uniref:hypothetical protein n=1 Tax=Hyalangium versicolor TaxID=2861190 RepID=UPI001CCF7089|nr:hypothetical protein [Hyalangium versicolor]
MRSFAMPLLVLTLLALTGCKRADTPVNAYTTFHDQVRKGEYKKAYAALSQATRDALAARTQSLKEASGGTMKAEPYDLLFVNSAPPADVTEVTLVKEEGDVATVRVLSSGQPHEVKLVREPSGWKIDLSESLKP